MKDIILLGSTGSIGTQTLVVISRNKPKFNILALTSNENISLLNKQIGLYKPKYVCIGNKKLIPKIKFKGKIFSGKSGLMKIIQMKKKATVVNALSGMIGVDLSLLAIKSGKSLALANKESMVTQGAQIMKLSKKHGVSVIPVDSELTALHHLLKKFDKNEVAKAYITCSGGPFWQKSIKELKKVTINQALKHPKWNMGIKNTLDSATLLNKALELIAANQVFNMEIDQPGVVIDPQVRTHAFLRLKDGQYQAVIAKKHDMKVFIKYALAYPSAKLPIEKIDFKKMKFTLPSKTKLSGIKIGYKVLEMDKKYLTKLCEVNEEAMGLFLEEKISFLGIYDYIYDHLNFKL